MISLEQLTYVCAPHEQDDGKKRQIHLFFLVTQSSEEILFLLPSGNMKKGRKVRSARRVIRSQQLSLNHLEDHRSGSQVNEESPLMTHDATCLTPKIIDENQPSIHPSLDGNHRSNSLIITLLHHHDDRHVSFIQ